MLYLIAIALRDRIAFSNKKQDFIAQHESCEALIYMGLAFSGANYHMLRFALPKSSFDSCPEGSINVLFTDSCNTCHLKCSCNSRCYLRGSKMFICQPDCVRHLQSALFLFLFLKPYTSIYYMTDNNAPISTATRRATKPRERNSLLKKYYGLKDTAPTATTVQPEENARPFDLGK